MINIISELTFTEQKECDIIFTKNTTERVETMDFSDKVALVTGAAVGIGRATAMLFAANGAKVAAVDVNEEALFKLKTSGDFPDGSIETFTCDVSKENEVSATAKKVTETFGKVDILVNNAAVWRCCNSFLEVSNDEWRRYFDINVMGTVNFTKAVLPGMIERRFGRIINVSSVAGVFGNANMAHYSATKGAINALTSALAKEYAEYGITVNATAPGTVSPSENSDINHTIENELSYMGRTGSDRENASLICYLAGDEAAYISGQVIRIDGCRKRI